MKNILAGVMAIVLTVASCSNVMALQMDKLRDKYAPNKIGFYDEDACADGTSAASTVIAGAASISGSTPEEKIWSGLRSLGVSEEVTAGIMGNMYRESTYNPVVFESSFKDSWNAGFKPGTGISLSDGFDWEHDTDTTYKDNNYSRGIGLVGWSWALRVEIWSYMKKASPNLVSTYFEHPEDYGGLSGQNFVEKLREDGKQADADSLYSLQITNLINEQLKTKKAFDGILDQTTVKDAAYAFADKFENCSTCASDSKRIEKAEEIFSQFSGKTSFGTSTTVASASTDGSQITIIGDSITHGTKSIFEEKLPGVDIHAEISKHFYMTPTSGAPGGDSGLTILRQLVEDKKLRSVLVFALGTNDVDGVQDYVDDVLEIAKDAQKIVFVTNYIRDVDFSYNNDAFNDAAKNDSRVVVADWASIAKEKDEADKNNNDSPPTFLDSMYTHPNTDEAKNAFVDVILQALNGSSVTTTTNPDDICCDPSQSNNLSATGGIYPGGKYNFNDDDIKDIAAQADKENGTSIEAIKSEASIMANLFEDPNHGNGQAGDTSGFLSYIHLCPTEGWFSSCNVRYTGTTSQDKIDAVKDVLVNGNRTLPPQILEHDWIYDLTLVIGPDGTEYRGDSIPDLDKSVFQRGKTEIHNNSGATYFFWDWADPTNQSGDPFGYPKGLSPPSSTLQPTKGSSSATLAGSDVTFSEDGWIQGGLNGFSKMELSSSEDPDMFGAEYVTDGLDGEHDKGPNKITLHAFEGPGNNESLIQETYEKGYPPHFTIDIKTRKVYQHMSIWKTSSAIAGTEYGDQSAGIQIEIMGYDNEKEYNDGLPDAEGWDLSSNTDFTDEDWLYLAELLNAISVETNIPLTSSVDWSKEEDDSVRLNEQDFKDYTGILGHKHTPVSSISENNHYDLQDPVIWDYIQKALSSFTSNQQSVCPTVTASGDVKALQQLVEDWVWKIGESGHTTTTRKPKYAEVADRRASEDKYVGGGVANGVDCGGFVTTIVQESGWDTNYNSAKLNTTGQLQYLQDSNNGWIEVTNQIHSNENAQPGDVIIRAAETVDSRCQGTGHTLIYVGLVPGFTSPLSEASVGGPAYAPSETSNPDIMNWINKGFCVFRKVGK